MPMISEGVLIATVLGMLAKEGIAFSLLKRREKNNGNGKNGVGKARVCIENGKQLVEHDVVIKQLCANMEKYEKTAETARVENNKAHDKIFNKLDALK